MPSIAPRRRPRASARTSSVATPRRRHSARSAVHCTHALPTDRPADTHATIAAAGPGSGATPVNARNWTATVANEPAAVP